MSIQEIIKILTSAGIEPNEANVEVKMLIEHFCNYTRTDILAGRKLDENKLEIVRQKAELRAKTRQPVQYIIGKAWFMGNYYKVNKNVLIPRDETELVVRHALELAKRNGYKTALDMGTGSGCIACTLSEYGMTVEGVDVSQDALDVAKENAKNLYQNVKFTASDLFGKISDKYDLIISNPPYIPAGVELQAEVNFEPKLALFTNDEKGVEFYKKIVSEAKNYLNSGGSVVFELGIDQSAIVKSFFEERGYKNIVIKKDLAGIDRVISAQI